MSKLNLMERKVALYVRSEDGRRSAENNDRQERMLLAYANHQEVNEIVSYEDISSSSDKDRPALKRLLEDAHEGKIDTILVTDKNRLSRSVFSQVAIEFKLRELGVTLIALQQFPQSAEDQLLNGMQNAFAEHERALWAERVKQALKSGKKYARCPHCGQLRDIKK